VKGRAKGGHEAKKMDYGTSFLTVHSDGSEQRLSEKRLKFFFPKKTPAF